MGRVIQKIRHARNQPRTIPVAMLIKIARLRHSRASAFSFSTLSLPFRFCTDPSPSARLFSSSRGTLRAVTR